MTSSNLVDGTWQVRDRGSSCRKETRLIKFGSDGEIWELKISDLGDT